jgi:hypothetical protein
MRLLNKGLNQTEVARRVQVVRQTVALEARNGGTERTACLYGSQWRRNPTRPVPSTLSSGLLAPLGSKGDDVITYRLFIIIRVLVGIGLLVATSGSVLCQGPSARDVLERFCELDAQGEQLTPDGWKKIRALFVAPGAPQRDEIVVVKDFVVSLPAFEKATAEFYVEYIQLGRIDPLRVRFSPLPPLKVRAGFYVTKQSGPGSGGAEPAEWRIIGPVPEPHVTVDTAIRYAGELREKARDVGTRKRADRMLAALKHFR